MTVPEPSRRRFLSLLAALGGVGVLGGIAWAERKTPGSATEAAINPTSTAPSTTGAVTTTTARPPPATTSTGSTITEPPEPVETTVPKAAAATTLAVICPEAWGAQPIVGEFRNHNIERLTIHHTAVVLDTNSAAPARARQHQAYHQELGWPDLAYHFLVDANGHVYEGRPVDAVGDTATDYDPTGHFLVSCEGHFDNQDVPAAQLAALIDILAWAAQEFGVSPETIRGHRDLASTTCPGDALYRHVSSWLVEDSVNERLSGGRVDVERLCGDDAVALVSDIESGSI